MSPHYNKLVKDEIQKARNQTHKKRKGCKKFGDKQNNNEFCRAEKMEVE